MTGEKMKNTARHTNGNIMCPEILFSRRGNAMSDIHKCTSKIQNLEKQVLKI